MLLKLIRTHTHRQAVIGQLLEVNPITGDKILCDTLENQHFLIPELIYPVRVTFSPRFQRPLPLIDQVPSRSGIRIHAGNTYKDSQGCVLVGNRETPNSGESERSFRLCHSRAMEQSLTGLLLLIQRTHEEIRLEVTHLVPDYPGYPYVDYTDRYVDLCDAVVVSDSATAVDAGGAE